MKMPTFLPTERRKRHTYIASTIENYLDILNKNDARSGYIHPSISRRYREVIDNLVVPNIRDGVLSLGKAALKNDSFIPVWAGVPGEVFYTATKLDQPSPQQTTLARKILSSCGLAPPDQDAALHAFDPEFPISLVPDCGAMATGKYSWAPLPGSIGAALIKSRPAIVFNMLNLYDHKKYSKESPDTLHHEIVHITQDLDHPVVRMQTYGDYEDLLLADEVEAYLHQADIVQELGHQEYVPATNENRPTYRSYSIALTAREIVRQFGAFNPPQYYIGPRSNIVSYIRTNRAIPLLTARFTYNDIGHNTPLQ